MCKIKIKVYGGDYLLCDHVDLPYVLLLDVHKVNFLLLW